MSAVRKITDLRQLMILQRAQDMPDGSGGFARNWLTVAEIWAAIEDIAVRPDFEAGRHTTQSTHRITIRWRPDMTGAMRLQGAAGTFLVHAAHDADGKRARMRLYCERLNP